MATGARKSPIVPKVLLTVWPVDRSDSDGASTIEAQVIHTPESACFGVGHSRPGFEMASTCPIWHPGHTLAEAAAEPPPTALRLDQVEKLLTDRSRWHWHFESAALLSTQSPA